MLSGLRHSRLYRALRTFGRSMGLNPMIARLLSGNRYEDRFDRELCAALRPGDCVWDVGANVGHYTTLFSLRVGSAGKVVAFEPSPLNSQTLTKATHHMTNVQCMTIALGNAAGRLGFLQDPTGDGQTSRCLAKEEGAATPTFAVIMRRGDDVVREDRSTAPNAIKIDVEGFELEVLEGLGDLLALPHLHTIGVEVHFAILEQRGSPGTPKAIEHLLATNNFKVSWVDHSHLIGKRCNRPPPPQT